MGGCCLGMPPVKLHPMNLGWTRKQGGVGLVRCHLQVGCSVGPTDQILHLILPIKAKLLICTGEPFARGQIYFGVKYT